MAKKQAPNPYWLQLAMNDGGSVAAIPVAIGEEVSIDGGDVSGIVTAITVRRGPYVMIEVSWMHNAESRCAFFESWRITPKEAA